jgi:predicted esterase
MPLRKRKLIEGNVRGQHPVPLVIVLLVAVFTAGVGPIPVHVGAWSLQRDRHAHAAATGVTRTVQAVTSTGRQGAYYLPRGHESQALPLLVFFHGTGGKGSLAILRLRALAEHERFIVLAPDSVSVAGVWAVGQRSGETTEDRNHVMTCVREIMADPGVKINVARVVAAGFSVGANAAAYFATHEAIFTDLAILHGHVVPGTMGPRRPRTWISGGDRDRVRTVEYMRSVADHLEQQGFPKVELRVFRADHTLQDDELTGLVAWWLSHRADRSYQAWPTGSAQVHAVYPRPGRPSRLPVSPPSLGLQKTG